MDLAADIEARLGRIFALFARIEEDRHDEIARAREPLPGSGPAGADCVAAAVAIAPCASTPSAPAETLVKTTPKQQNQPKRRVS